MHLSKIQIFPVKSLAGAPHAAAQLEPRGLRGDRRWMVVDLHGALLSQRDLPLMTLIHAEGLDGAVRLAAAGHGEVLVEVPAAGTPPLQVSIWRDRVAALPAAPAAEAWLSAVLGVACRLVFQADAGCRPTNPATTRPGDVVSFADGYPVLVANEASLADLNGRLATPVEMLRFRPNLVVSGAAAWAEDRWRRVRIGGAVLRVVKPCDRCIVTTIDPHTGLRPNKAEPLRTLATFRRDARGVMFGQNLVPEVCGEVRVGDTVEVLEVGEANVVLV